MTSLDRLRRLSRALRRRLRPASQPTAPSSPGPPPADPPDERLVAEVETARWTDRTRYEIAGYAYLKGVTATADARPTLEVWVEDRRGTRRLDAGVVQRVDPTVNATAGDTTTDYSGAAFTAVVDFDAAAAHGLSSGRLTTRLRLRSSETDTQGGFRTRSTRGSAGRLVASGAHDGRCIRPRWTSGDGLQFTWVAAPVVLASATVHERRVQLSVEVPRAAEITAAVISGGEPREERVEPVSAGVGHQLTFGFDVPPAAGDGLAAKHMWDVRVRDAEGEQHAVFWSAADRGDVRQFSGHGLRIFDGKSGVVKVAASPAVIVSRVGHVVDPAPGVGVQGVVDGVDREGIRFELRGLRTSIAVEDVTWDAERFELVVPLVASLWGGRPAPLLQGTYRLWAVPAAGAAIEIQLAGSCFDELPFVSRTDRLTTHLVQAGANRLGIELKPPMRPDEIGKLYQARLRRSYDATDLEPDGSVYFESFYGTNATDSPRSVHDELMRRGATMTKYWGVADYSVQVPEGATPVLLRSREWWDALARSTYFVHNCGTPWPLQPRPDQVVLQTWHGTPLKLLGSDRPGNHGKPEFVEQISRVSDKWSYLIAGNPYSAAIFRSAWYYDGPVLELGYPRNDPLAGRAAEQEALIRRRLGIGAGTTVVLYAPTWREGERGVVGLLDLDEVSAAVGPDHVFLVRGHDHSLHHGDRLEGEHVIDVTTYPLINDLFLVADVLVTDYSSVMFDYSVTGKPMLFYVPDIDDYRDRRRGVYFDLGEISPGPLLTTTPEVVEALEGIDEVHGKHAARYAAWQQKFNPLDDGSATRRVVDEVFGGDVSAR